MRVLGALDRIHGETGASLAAIALAWTSAQPGIVSTLASATSVGQLAELTQALQLKLTPEQVGLLDDASAEAVSA
jgi:aryl-alcohol dehydrogenase-like predicted oxidoreductase